jgi:hypothetical protein
MTRAVVVGSGVVVSAPAVGVQAYGSSIGEIA